MSVAVSHRSEEVEPLDERALRLRHDDEDALAARRHFWCAAAAWEAHLRRVVVADHRRVDVGKAVDLCGAEESNGDAAACSQYRKNSGTDTVVRAVAHSSPSPIESGSTEGRAPIVPDS